MYKKTICLHHLIRSYLGLRSLQGRSYLLVNLIKLAQCIPLILINDSGGYNRDNGKLIVYQWVVRFGLMRLLLVIVFRQTVKVMSDYDL